MTREKRPIDLSLPVDGEQALSKALLRWRKRKDVAGILLAGSYATGLATKFSDIDLYIVLSDQANNRERGNDIIDGWIIEYNADPIRYVRSLQREQYHVGLRHCARKVATGKVLFERDATLKNLQEEARRFMRKKLPRKNKIRIEMMKYYLWDQIDNLRDLAHQKSAGFEYAYYCGLQMLFGFYGEYLGAELLRPVRVHQFMTDSTFREKYAIEAFPDAVFMRMASRCMIKVDLKRIEKLTFYVQEKMGGFKSDGWRLRARVPG